MPNCITKFYQWLDNILFPLVTKFWANPWNILLTMVLFLPLVGLQNDVILVLLINSWMNTGSFSTSQITLREVILTADAQERRANETHDASMAVLSKMNEAIGLLSQEIQSQKEEITKINLILGDESQIYQCYEEEKNSEEQRHKEITTYLREIKQLIVEK